MKNSGNKQSSMDDFMLSLLFNLIQRSVQAACDIKDNKFAKACNSFCLLIFAANSSIFNETELLDLPLAFETNTFLKLVNLSSFRQSLKMAKHTQTIRRQIGDELFKCV